MLVDLSPDEVAFLFSYNPIPIRPVPYPFLRSHFRRLRCGNGRLFIYFEIGVCYSLLRPHNQYLFLLRSSSERCALRPGFTACLFQGC